MPVNFVNIDPINIHNREQSRHSQLLMKKKIHQNRSFPLHVDSRTIHVSKGLNLDYSKLFQQITLIKPRYTLESKGKLRF